MGYAELGPRQCDSRDFADCMNCRQIFERQIALLTAGRNPQKLSREDAAWALRQAEQRDRDEAAKQKLKFLETLT